MIFIPSDVSQRSEEIKKLPDKMKTAYLCRRDLFWSLGPEYLSIKDLFSQRS